MIEDIVTIEDIANVLGADVRELERHFQYQGREKRIEKAMVWSVLTRDNRKHLILSFREGILESAVFNSFHGLRWGMWETNRLCSWENGDGELENFVDCLLRSLETN